MDKDDKKEYEIAFLLVSPEKEEGVAKILQDNEAEIFHQKSVNKINLAYPIKKHDSAYFGFYHFRASRDGISKIRETLRLNSDVLRFLIVTPPIEAAAPQPIPSRPVRKQPEPVLSNEALSEKLEEILK